MSQMIALNIDDVKEALLYCGYVPDPNNVDDLKYTGWMFETRNELDGSASIAFHYITDGLWHKEDGPAWVVVMENSIEFEYYFDNEKVDVEHLVEYLEMIPVLKMMRILDK